MDSFPPPLRGDPPQPPRQGEAGLAREFAEMLGLSVNGLRDDGIDPAVLARMAQEQHHVLASLEPAVLARLLAVWRNNVGLHARCALGRLDADLLLFVAGEPRSGPPLQAAAELWRPHVGGRLLSHAIPCQHQAMCQPAPLAMIGDLIRRHIAALPADAARNNQQGPAS